MVVVVVVLWLVPLMHVVGRGSVDGRLGVQICMRSTGRAVGCASEQCHETDHNDRTDLSGSPGQLGKAVKPRVPRGIRGVAGPDRVTGVGIVACPALRPEWRRSPGIRRPVSRGGVALVGVVCQPISGTALQLAAMHRVAVGVVRVEIRARPAGRAEPGSTGRFRPLCVVQAAAGPVRRPGLGIGREKSRLAGVDGEVLWLVADCPVRAAGLPRPAICWRFIVVWHIRQDSTGSVKRP
jgi:hypothetical protein